MTTAKIDVKIGALSFAGEGDKEWLAKQLDKLIQHAPGLLNFGGGGGDDGGNAGGGAPEPKHKSSGKGGTLAAYLTAKSAKTSGNKKFLATAAWLHAKGQNRLTTGDVTKALDDNSQGKVVNPSLCLIRNAKKGYCEKSGKQFYVTDEGYKHLG